jgi:hypothetical protein
MHRLRGVCLFQSCLVSSRLKFHLLFLNIGFSDKGSMSFSLKGEIVFQIEENFILGRVIFLEGKSFIASYMIYHVFLFCV